MLNIDLQERTRTLIAALMQKNFTSKTCYYTIKSTGYHVNAHLRALRAALSLWACTTFGSIHLGIVIFLPYEVKHTVQVAANANRYPCRYFILSDLPQRATVIIIAGGPSELIHSLTKVRAIICERFSNKANSGERIMPLEEQKIEHLCFSR